MRNITSPSSVKQPVALLKAIFYGGLQSRTVMICTLAALTFIMIFSSTTLESNTVRDMRTPVLQYANGTRLTRLPPKRVVIAGIERSGSTWQFLAVRSIMARRGYSNLVVMHTHSLRSILDSEDCLKSNSSCIVKIHEFEPALVLHTDTILTSHRDLRDILLSISQTFGSCLHTSKVQCPGNPSLLTLPRDLPLGLSVHMEHYLHWKEIAHYDMSYELMMQNQTEEVVRLSKALGIEVDTETAGSIVEELEAISIARQEVKKEWDPNTGLKRDHVHASSKIRAHKDKELVKNLSFPNGPCKLEEEFLEIEATYGLWMSEMKYDSDEFAYFAKEPHTRSLQNPDTNELRIIHVVNYFGGSPGAMRSGDQGLHSWELVLTQESIRRAFAHAKSAGVSVSFVAAVFEGEDEAAGVLREFASVCILSRGKSEYFGSKKGPKVPYIQDILNCAIKKARRNSKDTIIYTNADIGLNENFYVYAAQLAAVSLNSTSYSITRRELFYNKSWPESARTNPVATVISAQTAAGETHSGHDTFIVPIAMAQKLNLQNVTIAFSPWGCTLETLLDSFGSFRVLDRTGLTFHFGTVPAIPDVSPYPWMKCGDLSCRSKDAAGLCCATCNRSAEQCNWHKSYNIARYSQTSSNWAPTIDNAMESFVAIRDAAPLHMRRCCAFAAKGAEVFERLDKHWSNIHSASGGCCAKAANPFYGQGPVDIVNAWCAANVKEPLRYHTPDKKSTTVSSAKPLGTGNSKQTVLVVHEHVPSKREGGDFRAYQIVQWLAQNGYYVVLVARTGMSENCKLKEANYTSNSSHAYILKSSIVNTASHLHDLVKLSTQVDVVEDDLCISRTLAALQGTVVDEHIPSIRTVRFIFATLWFYRKSVDDLSLPSIPELLIAGIGDGIKKSGTTLSIISDDIHHERAEIIAIERGDNRQRALAIRKSEISTYSSSAVSYVLSVTEEDAQSYRNLILPSKRPIVMPLPFVANPELQEDFNCTTEWWSSVTYSAVPHRSFADREGLIFLGSGHYANIQSVNLILNVVVPMWAYMLQYRRMHNKFPTFEECPRNFNETAISVQFQSAVPSFQLVGTKMWSTLLLKAQSRNSHLKYLYKKVTIPASGFVPHMDHTLNTRRILLAPNLVRGSGISTKVMTGLQAGLPVVVNSWGANGYDCKDTVPGRLRCKHIAISGPELQSERQKIDVEREGYWMARVAMGIYTDKMLWTKFRNAGLDYVRHNRTMKSWDPVLNKVFRDRDY